MMVILLPEKTNQKILVVGSEGQLGTALRAMVPEGFEVLGVDCDILDITDQQAVFELISDFCPKQVINAAAYTDVDTAEKEPDEAMAVNCQGVVHLATAAKAVGARLLHVSTDYVFNGQGNTPYRPDDPTDPINAYGASKRAGEVKLREILPENHVLVRTSWLYSPWGENFVKTMLRLMRERDEVRVVADQIGTPTSAPSLAEVLWLLVQKPEVKGTYHWTDAGVASWYDLACLVCRYGLELGLLPRACKVIPIPTAQYPTSAARPTYSVLDTTSLSNLLEVQPIHWSVRLLEVLQDLLADGQTLKKTSNQFDR